MDHQSAPLDVAPTLAAADSSQMAQQLLVASAQPCQSLLHEGRSIHQRVLDTSLLEVEAPTQGVRSEGPAARDSPNAYWAKIHDDQSVYIVQVMNPKKPSAAPALDHGCIGHITPGYINNFDAGRVSGKPAGERTEANDLSEAAVADAVGGEDGLRTPDEISEQLS